MNVTFTEERIATGKFRGIITTRKNARAEQRAVMLALD